MTDAFGTAKFFTNKQGSKLKFQLEVNDQAHIHFGARGENGPVLVFLFGADIMTIEEQHGISTRRGIVTGIITDEDIAENSVRVKSVRDLLKLMQKKLNYVNVHTEQNPDGEIRGQIIPVR
ncbi:CHRD domain-containing protein [Gracilibacillus salitolerans]|uniref:CHRD domain-containing protein n=2 Tax=Gracilibacillus salitolerans TaxID=2663022 RepID=A0A5Q2TQE2_9BACI|nr:CHRD domain-containing protein [Gracilibacillus salitolerans]